MTNIIVVDDDKVLRKNLAFYLKSQNYDVDVASSGEEAIEMAQHKFYNIVISDIRMSNMTGFEFMRKYKGLYPASDIILVTGFGNIPMAVEAMQGGAADFLCKPFEYGGLLTRIERLLRRKDIGTTDLETESSPIIAESQKMRDIIDLIDKAAGTAVSALIEGEAGTGKELIARTIHERSTRRDNSFYILECSTAEGDDLQAELFGKWDSNQSERAGMLVRANGGTLLIKDIERLSLNMQTRILRFLQDGFFTVSGMNQKIKSDVRIISSSSTCLKDLTLSGKFREDLFYAINIMPIFVPPLRNRTSDIFPLVNYFMKIYCQKFDKSIRALSPQILTWMQTYQWPGNVAELENIIARACALSDSDLIDESLIFTLPKDRPITRDEPAYLNITLKDNQKALILKVLKQNEGNYTRTAQQLGISRTTLWRRMKKFKLEEVVVE